MAEHRAADCTCTGADRGTVVLSILRASGQQDGAKHDRQVSGFHILAPFIIDIVSIG
jgi:hypothetical protein